LKSPCWFPLILSGITKEEYNLLSMS
jgi:hypothetical protein